MWRKNSSVAVGSDVAERIDIATRQNESCTLTIALYNPTTGQPFNLTGYTLTLAIDAGSTNVLTATAGTGLTIAAPLTGVINVNLDTTQMAFPAGNYTYRLTAASVSSTKTWLQGIVYHVAQSQIQPASDTLMNLGKTYVRIGNTDILVSMTNN